MPTFEVGMKFDSTVWVPVEVEHEDEAQEKAESQFDPADYMEAITHGYWVPDQVELVDDGTDEEEA